MSEQFRFEVHAPEPGVRYCRLPRYCAVADAVRRTVPNASRVWCAYEQIRFSGKIWHTPPAVREWMQAHDERRPVFPFCFELKGCDEIETRRPREPRPNFSGTGTGTV